MYCSTCGVAVAQGLSYCNYCGATLSGEKISSVRKPAGVKPELLVSSMVVVFVFGLGAITVLLGVMKAVANFELGPILAITLLSFLMMLLVEGVFVYLLLSGKRGAKEPGDARLAKERGTNELDAANVQLLPEPVPSVTEQTTRTLAPTYNKRT